MTDTSRSVATTRETRPRRWDPFAMFTELEAEMDRMFGQRLPAFLPIRRYTGALGEGWAPSTDVFEKDGDIVVKAELPGVRKDDINVSVEQGSLVIKGERTAEEEVKEENFYRSERFTGAFYRRFPLPQGVDEDKSTADYTDGVLEVHVPKPGGEAAKPEARKIQVS
ncbi:MAG TPA: Hsp20/alpha crystallin family protein [Thermomicrobiales bacterium]|nr:Hsp20/alpha crystallin family protein [Thermomicrobiales bacterium]